MKTYALLGKNISYSLSPAMHNAAFGALGIKAEYKIFDKSADELEGFFSSLKDGKIAGCNVTMPYKEKALDHVDEVSPATKIIGALNTVVSRNGILEGHNTDYQGFMKALMGKGGGDLGFLPEGKDVFIFGAGGAAKAIVYVLSRVLKVKKIIIADIDANKAENLASSIMEKQNQDITIAVAHDESQYSDFISQTDLLINATPCGMKDTDPALFDYKEIREGLYIFDLIYTKETKLVKEARARNARCAGGLNMLLYQAAKAFEYWTKKDAPLPVMRKALLEKLTK